MRHFEQEYDGRTMYFRQLDSIGEMIDAMQHAPEQQKQSGLRAASLEIDEWRWSDTKTMDEALELARYGWEEGRQHLRQAVGRIALDQLVGRRPIVESRLDFAGDEVDIGAYLHGEPEHMVDYQVRQDTHGKQAMMYVNASWLAESRPSGLCSVVGRSMQRLRHCVLRGIHLASRWWTRHKIIAFPITLNTRYR